MDKLIVLSDLHITAPGKWIVGLDPLHRFRTVLSHAIGQHPDARAVVLLGDLAHRGRPEEYARLAGALSGLQPPVIPMIGNHDRRDALRAAFPDAPVTPEGFLQGRYVFGETTVLTLDTVDGPPYDGHAGRLCDDRLDWLDRELRRAAGSQVLVFAHHPAFPVGLPGMDRIRLADSARLLDRLARHGRCHLVAGHVHRTISGSTRGVPWTILKSPCHQAPLDLATDDSSLSIDEPGAYALALLCADGIVIHTADVLTDPPPIGRDAASGA